MAAEREYGLLLARATGMPCAADGAGIAVSVRPHPAHGTHVSIGVTGAPESARTELTGQIHAVMGQFPYAFSVTWQPPIPA